MLTIIGFLFDMGKKFKVLLLQKNIPQKMLTGFQFKNLVLKNKQPLLNEILIT
jgi:hypothetical protein